MTLFELFGQAPVYFALICILSVLAVSISKSGFGGALGAISMPILIFVMPPKMAIGVLLPLFLITDVWVVYLWRQWVNWRFLFLMAGFGVTGQLLGWLLFDYLSDRVLTRVIGIGNDMAIDEGIGVCGKAGQSVPAGVGQPTLLVSGLTVGGTA